LKDIGYISDGIDVGKNPKTGIEVEGGEVMHMGDKMTKIYSAQPIIGGYSPANLVLAGADPNKVFRMQERYKKVNGVNDDGTKRKKAGTGNKTTTNNDLSVDVMPNLAVIDPSRIHTGAEGVVGANDVRIGGSGIVGTRYRRPNGDTYVHYDDPSTVGRLAYDMAELKAAQDRRYALDNLLETMQRNSEMMSNRYGTDWRNSSPYGMSVGNGEDVAATAMLPLALLAACDSKPTDKPKIASSENLDSIIHEAATNEPSDTINVNGMKLEPVFNPATNNWYQYGFDMNYNKGLTFEKDFGKTVYTPDGFAVNYDKNGNEIGRTKGTQTPYIGSRQKYFDVDKELTDSVKIKANRYGISPDLLASRLADEGIIDRSIRMYNESSHIISHGKPAPDLLSESGTFRHDDDPMPDRHAYSWYGLDDAYDYIKSNKDIIKEPWIHIDNEPQNAINEKYRKVNSVKGITGSDAISVMAAILKMQMDKIKEKYPNATSAQLDNAAGAAYNMGLTGALKVIKKKGFAGINKYKPNIKLNK